MSECRDGTVNTFYVHPADFGLPKAARRVARGRRRGRQRRDRAAVLGGAPGPARDIVLLNAGAALFVSGRAPTVRDGLAMAGDGDRLGPRAGRSGEDGRPRRGARHDARTGAPDVLAAILAATRAIVEARKAVVPDGTAGGRGRRAPSRRPAVRSSALARPGSLNVIAECKRRSPSRGVLRADYDAAAIARALRGERRRRDLGADRADVLRRVARRSGRRPARASSLPVLRKDFVVDEYQLVEARAAGADAVLLIVAALDDERLRALHEGARALGLAALVEVHTREELDRALAAVAGAGRRQQPRPAGRSPSIRPRALDSDRRDSGRRGGRGRERPAPP